MYVVRDDEKAQKKKKEKTIVRAGSLKKTPPCLVLLVQLVPLVQQRIANRRL